jgi:hypothetical protein
MFLHHIATVMLLTFSYIVNFVRIGTLVLIVHDCGDYWLEVNKRQRIDGINKRYLSCLSRARKWLNTLEHKNYVIFYSSYLHWFGSLHVYVTIRTCKRLAVVR